MSKEFKIGEKILCYSAPLVLEGTIDELTNESTFVKIRICDSIFTSVWPVHNIYKMDDRKHLVSRMELDVIQLKNQINKVKDQKI